MSNNSNILSIAQQCPYVGGNAVIRARVWLSMINDSIDYNDNAVCLQSGIYRLANDTTSENIKSEDIKIIPNPASDKVTITLSDDMSEICEILFYDVVGKLVLSKELECNQKNHILNVKNLSEGIYMVKVKQSVYATEQYKFVKAR